jgi:hypothetical protein
MLGKDRMPSSRTLLLVITAALPIAGGCRRIPDEVPYEAHVSEKHEGSSEYRVRELVGADLMLDGKKVAELEDRNTRVTVMDAGAARRRSCARP